MSSNRPRVGSVCIAVPDSLSSFPDSSSVINVPSQSSTSTCTSASLHITFLLYYIFTVALLCLSVDNCIVWSPTGSYPRFKGGAQSWLVTLHKVKGDPLRKCVEQTCNFCTALEAYLLYWHWLTRKVVPLHSTLIWTPWCVYNYARLSVESHSFVSVAMICTNYNYSISKHLHQYLCTNMADRRPVMSQTCMPLASGL